jgi:hypothetical protein
MLDRCWVGVLGWVGLPPAPTQDPLGWAGGRQNPTQNLLGNPIPLMRGSSSPKKLRLVAATSHPRIADQLEEGLARQAYGWAEPGSNPIQPNNYRVGSGPRQNQPNNPWVGPEVPKTQANPTHVKAYSSLYTRRFTISKSLYGPRFFASNFFDGLLVLGFFLFNYTRSLT